MSPTDKQRREAERRRLKRQVERRKEQAARRQRATVIASIVGAVVILVVVVAFVVVNSGGDPSPKAGGSTTPSSTGTASTAAKTYPCTWDAASTQQVTRTVSVPSTTTPPKSGTVTVALSTSRGPITFALDRAEAPCTVASFVSLVQQKYFDGTSCHRLTTPSSGISVLQCGDPTGTGAGGPGYTVPDEGKAGGSYGPGVLAMARSATAHSGGGQFFIVYQDSPFLASGSDGNYYTIFGKVASGMSVVDKVAAAGVSTGGADGKPKLPITFTKVQLAA